MQPIRAPFLALAAALVAAAPASAQPETGADEGVVRYRQKVMSAVGADMGAIGDIMKYGLPLPMSHVAAHAESIARHAELAGPAFERRVVDGPTDAKPQIWEEPDRFREKLDAMKKGAGELAAVAGDGSATPAAVGQRVKALGDRCGSCHDAFRKPKEESYKRDGGA